MNASIRRTVIGVAAAALFAVGAAAGTSPAIARDWHHGDHHGYHHGWHHGYGYVGGGYVSPYYGGYYAPGYYDPGYYYPPPVVYGPAPGVGVGINLPGVSVGIGIP